MYVKSNLCWPVHEQKCTNGPSYRTGAASARSCMSFSAVGSRGGIETQMNAEGGADSPKPEIWATRGKSHLLPSHFFSRALLTLKLAQNEWVHEAHI